MEAVEATKSYAKGEDTVDHGRVTRWLKKFHSGYKNLDTLVRSDRPKTMDSAAMLQAIEAYLVSSTQRVSGELSISLSSVFHHLHDFSKSIRSYHIVPLITKYCKTF